MLTQGMADLRSDWFSEAAVGNPPASSEIPPVSSGIPQTSQWSSFPVKEFVSLPMTLDPAVTTVTDSKMHATQVRRTLVLYCFVVFS